MPVHQTPEGGDAEGHLCAAALARPAALAAKHVHHVQPHREDAAAKQIELGAALGANEAVEGDDERLPLHQTVIHVLLLMVHAVDLNLDLVILQHVHDLCTGALATRVRHISELLQKSLPLHHHVVAHLSLLRARHGRRGLRGLIGAHTGRWVGGLRVLHRGRGTTGAGRRGWAAGGGVGWHNHRGCRLGGGVGSGVGWHNHRIRRLGGEAGSGIGCHGHRIRRRGREAGSGVGCHGNRVCIWSPPSRSGVG
mmetsp:Transcript_5089/g.9577  ORF Transcript_5089/g.9577 Transcript_5089/m.9577 type:complete len:252 (-) Transcript_5089:321-1076(-)